MFHSLSVSKGFKGINNVPLNKPWLLLPLSNGEGGENWFSMDPTEGKVLFLENISNIQRDKETGHTWETKLWISVAFISLKLLRINKPGNRSWLCPIPLLSQIVSDADKQIGSTNAIKINIMNYWDVIIKTKWMRKRWSRERKGNFIRFRS